MAQVKPDCGEWYAEAIAGLHSGIEAHLDGQECPVPWLTWEQCHAQAIDAVLNQTDYAAHPFWIDSTPLKGKDVPEWMPLHAVYGPDGLFCYVLGNERAKDRVEALLRILNANLSSFRVSPCRTEELIG